MFFSMSPGLRMAWAYSFSTDGTAFGGIQHVMRLLRRHELGEDQVLQLRVVLVPLVLVEDVEQRLGPCVRPLGLTAAGQIEQQLHLFLLVLKSSQPGRQQFFQLLLAVLFVEVGFGRLPRRWP